MLSALPLPCAYRRYTAVELGCEGSADLADLAMRWEALGRIAFPTAVGIVEYAGRWRGDPDGDWSQQGEAEAERRVRAWLLGLVEHTPESLRDAAALVLSSTTEAMLRAALAPKLKWWARGVSAAGGDGAAARAEAEAAAWTAFRRRCQELAESCVF